MAKVNMWDCFDALSESESCNTPAALTIDALEEEFRKEEVFGQDITIEAKDGILTIVVSGGDDDYDNRIEIVIRYDGRTNIRRWREVHEMIRTDETTI